MPHSEDGILRDAGALLIGTAASGLLAYAYVALGTRTFGAEAFAPVSVLWTIWAMSAAVVTFPVQHWVIRTVEVEGDEEGVGRHISLLVGIGLVVSAAMGAAAWLARSSLFSDSGILYPALVALIPIGSLAVGLMRGALSARGRFVSTAGAIGAENLIRVAVAVIVVSAGWGIEPFAIAIASGFLVFFAWPSALRFRRGARQGSHGSPLRLLAGIAGGTLIAQVVLTGGPLLLAAIGGAPAAVTGLFSALALFRAPYMLATGLASRVTGSLTRFMLIDARSAMRRLTMLTIAGVAVLAPLAGVFGAIAGPRLVQFVFGLELTLSPAVVGLVAAASAVALGSLFYMLVLVAAGRGRAITGPWVAAALLSLGWALLGPGTALANVTLAFLLGEVTALALMMVFGNLGRTEVISDRPVIVDDASPPVVG